MLNMLWQHATTAAENELVMAQKAGPSGRVVWGIGLDRLDAETMGSNPA
jgi:hypothetical protein